MNARRMFHCLQADDDKEFSQRHHRQGRKGRSPRGKQQIFCLWRSLSSALKKDVFFKSHMYICILLKHQIGVFSQIRFIRSRFDRYVECTN